MSKIGILGSGIVAKTLGSGFLKNGYEVMLGTRDTSKLGDWQAANPGGRAGSFAEAAAFGDLIVLSIKGSVAKDALGLAGHENLAGKTVIDTTNPIGSEAPQNGVLHFFSDINRSLLEDLQETVPAAHFVKAFSCIGSPYMVNPQGFEDRPSMFIAGNNEAARAQVREICELFGHQVEDMGKAEAARAIEPLCMLWCIPGMSGQGWSHAFRLMHMAQ